MIIIKKKGIKARKQSHPWSMAIVISGLTNQVSYSYNSRGFS